MTKVIHIKNAPKDWKNNPDFCYIGRSGKGLHSQFGNPYRLSEYTTLDEVIERYRIWFLETLERDSEFKQ